MGKRIVTNSSTSSKCGHDVNSDLFEEVLSLYTEEIENNHNNDKSYNSFKEYIEQMLPPDVLDYIQNITGADDTFLEDIYNERFLKSIDNNKNDDNESNDNTNKYPTRHCEICERYVSLTEHHLIPKETHRTMLKKGLYTKDTLSITISICRLCHSTIHRFFTNDE